MTPKQIKAKSLKHYDKMIAWAEQQKPREYPCLIIMDGAIKEGWYSKDCPHCNNYRCYDCPLDKMGITCCNGLWRKMENAQTWKTWIKYAKQVRQYIEEKG